MIYQTRARLSDFLPRVTELTVLATGVVRAVPVVDSFIWNGQHLTLLRVEVAEFESRSIFSTLMAGWRTFLNLGASYCVVVTGHRRHHQCGQDVHGNSERLTCSCLRMASLRMSVAITWLADRTP